MQSRRKQSSGGGSSSGAADGDPTPPLQLSANPSLNAIMLANREKEAKAAEARAAVARAKEEKEARLKQQLQPVSRSSSGRPWWTETDAGRTFSASEEEFHRHHAGPAVAAPTGNRYGIGKSLLDTMLSAPATPGELVPRHSLDSSIVGSLPGDAELAALLARISMDATHADQKPPAGTAPGAAVAAGGPRAAPPPMLRATSYDARSAPRAAPAAPLGQVPHGSSLRASRDLELTNAARALLSPNRQPAAAKEQVDVAGWWAKMDAGAFHAGDQGAAQAGKEGVGSSFQPQFPLGRSSSAASRELGAHAGNRA